MGFTNETVSLTLPSLELESGDIAGAIVFPAMSLLADDATASGAVTFPSLTAVSAVIQGVVSSAELTLPALSTSAAMQVGQILSFDKSFPALQVSASSGSAAGATLTFPALELAASMGLYGEWSAAFSLPALQLTAAAITDSAGAVTTTTDYVAWVVNEQTKQHGKYLNWLVNSFAEIAGAQFVATPAGVFELTGTADAGTNIDAQIFWAPSKLGTDKQKRIEQAFLRVRAGGALALIAITDEVEKRIYGQTMTGFPAHMYQKRVQPTRGLQGAFWQFGVKNTNGSTLELADVEVDVVTLTRRLKWNG